MNKFKVIALFLILYVPFLGVSQNKFSYKVDKSLYTTQKNVLIITEIGEKLNLDKTGFNHAVENFPELYQYPPLNPLETYLNSKLYTDSAYNEDERAQFYKSEQGQDVYFLLYAYFLKKKNGSQNFAAERKILTDIFYNINYIKCFISMGGTYYIHLYRTKMAEIEYDIFNLVQNDSSLFVKGNFESQKRAMLNSFKYKILDCDSASIDSIENQIFAFKNLNLQSIKKEIKGNPIEVNEFLRKRVTYNYPYGNEKLEYSLETDTEISVYAKKEILIKINLLDKLISNYYYFKWADCLDKNIY